MKFILNTEDLNSHNFIVKTDSVNLDKFKENPVMLYNHNIDKVIGRWDNIEKTEDKKILADAVFDENDEEAQKIKDKIDSNLIKGSSIGIKINDFEIDDQEVMNITDSELVEASITAIPSNKNAIRLYNQDMKELTDEDIVNLTKNSKNNISKKQFENMRNEILKTLNFESKEVTDQQVIDHVKELKESVSNLTNTLQEKENEITQLKDQIENINKEQKEKEIDETLNKALEEEKINKEQKEQYKKLAETDFETVKKILDNMTVKKDFNLTENIEDVSSEEDNWTFEDYRQKAPEKLKELKYNDYDKYMELYNKEFSDVK